MKREKGWTREEVVCPECGIIDVHWQPPPTTNYRELKKRIYYCPRCHLNFDAEIGKVIFRFKDVQ